LLDLIEMIEHFSGTRPRVTFAEERVGDQRWYVSDTSRLHAATGWEPRVSAPEGIEKLYHWLGHREHVAPTAA
jgi:CDP-paratose 2-epimerase